MPKQTFSGRYLPLGLGTAQLAYRTMRGNPRGAFRVRRCTNWRRTRVPQRRYVRQRIRLHQSARSSGIGGSFSNFYYGRRRGPMTSAFKANSTNYYSINGASPINIGVGVQTVTTVNCMYGAYGNTP